MAFGLCIYILIVRLFQENKFGWRIHAGIGFIVGLLFLWNMAIFFLLIAVLGIMYLSHKQIKSLCIFLTVAAITTVISVFPILPFLYKVLLFLQNAIKGTGGQPAVALNRFNGIDYLWENLGLLPLATVVGFFGVSKKYRLIFVPFIILFLCECLFVWYKKIGFDQKSFSFIIISINILAAIGLGWLWVKKYWSFKAGAVLFFGILIVSGIVDLLPIKNEFAFPLVNKETVPVISWITANTPKDAVFVSYSDMIDPAVLAGRKNYFGFYGNIGWYDRSTTVRLIYSGDKDAIKSNRISYVLVPKWQKNDFPYVPNVPQLRKQFSVGYEDARFIVFDVR